MKKFKKLTRIELKTLVGGAGPFEESILLDPVTCHVHYNGNGDMAYYGAGDCHNRGDGTTCKTYVAMGGSCY
ncbi:bacteriocin-like protein [Chryseobacterium salivictor]|uniref:Uncharacterized protein n=1 Tax=Chryseobacterium salivictor TaxID=2547600 RepID=A0A4P6ZI95_9FLAO|nr:hypothetical protein [Chryseobacterium salivictor]QBO59560.1 hypothetical protein NBC122_02759 [Chryseobacterium salivictor]